MDKEVLLERFKRWSLGVILMCRELPEGEEFRVIKYQIIKSSTSSTANYSASNRAKSRADMINKRKIVEEELDESLVWLDMLKRLLDSDWSGQLTLLEEEANELLRIITGSIISLRR